MTALKKWLSWEHLFAVKLLSEISPVELLMFWGALVSKCPAILCLISAHQLRQHFKIKEHKLLFHVGEKKKKKKSYERKNSYERRQIFMSNFLFASHLAHPSTLPLNCCGNMCCFIPDEEITEFILPIPLCPAQQNEMSEEQM